MGNDRGYEERDNRWSLCLSDAVFPCRLRGLHGARDEKLAAMCVLMGISLSSTPSFGCRARPAHFRTNGFEEYYSSTINLNNKTCHYSAVSQQFGVSGCGCAAVRCEFLRTDSCLIYSRRFTPKCLKTK